MFEVRWFCEQCNALNSDVVAIDETAPIKCENCLTSEGGTTMIRTKGEGRRNKK
jgi:hypothetical protein